MQENIMNLIEVALMSAIVKQPFFGSLLMSQELLVDNSVQTACTDGKRIKFNTAWFQSLPDHRRIFIVCHETMHTALCHHLRRGNRDPQLWNVATDYVINGMLVAAGLISAADCMAEYLYDTRFDGMSEEKVYSLLKQDQQQDDQQQDDGDSSDGQDVDSSESAQDGQDGDGAGEEQDGQSNGPHKSNSGRSDGKSAGEVEDGKNACDEQAKQAEMSEWTVKMEQAARAAEKRGLCPGWAKELISTQKQSQLDWREMLWDFMLQFGAGSDDCTFSRMNRRTRHLESRIGGRLPQMIGVDADELVIAVDTSASVPSWALGAFTAEINAIREMLDCTIHLVMCDTRINDVQTTDCKDAQFVTEYKGRGGTEFAPVFDWAKVNAPNCQALVYLTDLECTLPPEPSFPVLWITPWAVSKQQYGTVVTMGGKKSRYER